MEPTNRRRVVRALEVTVGAGRPFSSFGPGLEAYPPTPFTLVGIRFDPAVHDARIDAPLHGAARSRASSTRCAPWLPDPGGLSRTARQALGYRELLAHVEEGVPLDEAVAEAKRRTRAFARRQWAWFRRDPRISWLDPGGDLAGAAPRGCGTRRRRSLRTQAPGVERGGARLITMDARGTLRLTKHHGAGNDFLVLLDPDDRRPLSAAEARALCDRHRGIGADGVLRAVVGPRPGRACRWSCATPTAAWPR